ncbi:hypothetical protein HIM_11999 [Hirsutella minnesotensis 3608]|uniref:FAD-binding PCMH-type domain-containing protein n=1 Tax=Hirsutella minnesotensis 3608 TaxID=1043627 RepID=A0A0F7ZF67_9HYPO|nr:hypothetical protein HIM_11999 [Hirsutella minnesotensis 3608]
MKDYVVNLTVVLADGTVIKTRHRPRKTSAGYNLNVLFTGSEGTLGIITEITLKLVPTPANVCVATTTFPTIRQAADAASAIVRKGVPVAALELMDGTQMKLVNQNGGAGGRTWAELPTLFIKFSGAENAVAGRANSKGAGLRAEKLGLFNSILGHVGDGNFHQMIMYNPRSAEQQKGVEECVAAMVDKAVEMEGTISPRHYTSIRQGLTSQ